MSCKLFSSKCIALAALLLMLFFLVATPYQLLALSALSAIGFCFGLPVRDNRLANSPTGQQPDGFSGDKMVSMVALFETLPFVDEAVLAAHIKSAWNLELQNDQAKESFVVGSAPLFIIKAPHQMYAVNYVESNYFENLEEVLSDVTELRLSNAIRTHRAWISIDLVSDSQQLDPEQHYWMICKLLRQMINEDCVALVLPDMMKLIPWNDNIANELVSGSPINKLSPSEPPVTLIDNDNPKLVAAVAESRKRFPQFVAAFENHQRDEERDESNQFEVKAPIVLAGRTEFMWIAVTGIENGVLFGILDNQPVELAGLSRGDQVRVCVSKINDWIYTQGAETFGGFTTKVIAQWALDQKNRG